ncbi:hypothetical protein SUGI_0423510 [Cryptomeria japonica]|nr:hypothetical protein SUGI_0423510 [Cryptomeria japonica]
MKPNRGIGDARSADGYFNRYFEKGQASLNFSLSKSLRQINVNSEKERIEEDCFVPSKGIQLLAMLRSNRAR